MGQQYDLESVQRALTHHQIDWYYDSVTSFFRIVGPGIHWETFTLQGAYGVCIGLRIAEATARRKQGEG